MKPGKPLARRKPLRAKKPMRRGGDPARAHAAKLRAKRKAQQRHDEAFGRHADYVRSHPCAVCRDPRSEAHHEPPLSKGGKAKDLSPLCALHHRDGPQARHRLRNAERFLAVHGVNLLTVAADLWARSPHNPANQRRAA